MAVWTYYACQLTTGNVITELPLVNVSLQRKPIGGGALSAELSLQQAPVATRRDLLAATLPGRSTVVAVKDGKVISEWIVWKRRRPRTGTISLVGAELISYMDRRLFDFALDYTGAGEVDLVYIASNLANAAFRNSGFSSGAVTVTGSLLDGNLSTMLTGIKADRYYPVGDPIGQRFQELSEITGGFEYGIETAWAPDAPTRVVRSFNFYPHYEYPAANDPALSNNPWTVIDAQDVEVDEDSATLATHALAIGAGSVADDAATSLASDFTLINSQGFPRLAISHSWSTEDYQPQLDLNAAELLRASQSMQSPTVTIRDDAVSTAQLAANQKYTFVLDPCVNWPDGYSLTAKVLAYTMNPIREGVGTVSIELAGPAPLDPPPAIPLT